MGIVTFQLNLEVRKLRHKEELALRSLLVISEWNQNHSTWSFSHLTSLLYTFYMPGPVLYSRDRNKADVGTLGTLGTCRLMGEMDLIRSSKRLLLWA